MTQVGQFARVRRLTRIQRAQPTTLVKALNVEALQTQAWHTQARADGFEGFITTLHTFNAVTPSLNANADTALNRARQAGQWVLGYARPVECFVGGINGITAANLNALKGFILDVETETDAAHQVTQAMVNMLTNSGIRPIIYTIAGNWNTIMSSSTAFSAVALHDRYIISRTVALTLLQDGQFYYFGGWNNPNTARKIWQIDDPYTEQGTSVGLDYVDKGWLDNNDTTRPWRGFSFVKAPSDSNTVTDYTRALGTQGDGQAVGTSYGLWKTVTNRCTNGGATTNTTGWTNISGTISRITTGGKFFTVGGTPACFNFATSNLAANEGASTPISGGAAATQYTVSFWAKASAGSPTIIATLNDNVSGDQSSTPVTLTTSWQKVSVTATTGAGSVTWLGKFQTNVQQNVNYQIDGFQIETGPIATPYVETDGATAARSNSLLTLTVGSTAMTPTQGWVAFRVRPRWGTANEPYGGAAFPRVMTWRTDNSNGIFLRYEEATNVFAVRRVATTADPVTQAYAPASGTSATLIGAWDATTVYASVNGAARASAASTHIPTISNTFMDVLSLNASENFCGEVLWIAWGSGTLTDANCATIDAIGDTPPTPAAFPSGATVNAIFSGFFGFNMLRDTAA